MKRRIAWTLAIVAFAFAGGIVSRPWLADWKQHLEVMGGFSHAGATPYDAPHYARRVEQFAGIHQTQKVVFLGDSRIEAAEWRELFGRCDISNRGINGDTTIGLLQRLPASLPTANVLCIIQAGVNDLSKGSSVEAVVSNYRRIVDYLRTDKRSRVIITAVILVGQDQPQLNATIAQCNLRLAALSAQSGAAWVDVNAVLSPGGFLSPEYSNDGVHLNGRAYLKLRDALIPYLEERSG